MLAGRQGVSSRAVRNLNKDGLFSLKSHDTSDLAFSDSFVGFRPFAPVCGFFQRNETRNDTRCERLASSSHRKTYSCKSRHRTTLNPAASVRSNPALVASRPQ